MKYSIGFILAAILCLGFQTDAVAQQSDRDNYSVQVDGLGCPFCAYGLEKKFKAFKGIKDVKIDMESGMFTFSYPADKPLSVEKVEKQVGSAGYTPIHTKIMRIDGTVDESVVNETVLTAESVMKKLDFFVAGTCGMCKARIEKAAKNISGVTLADWDEDEQLLSVEFDTKQTSKSAIQEGMAAVGHDTKNARATKEMYKNLPACCRYKRAK